MEITTMHLQTGSNNDSTNMNWLKPVYAQENKIKFHKI
jgi:hypothetical protein